MERVVERFGSFEDAERAERAYYASLTGQQRLDILAQMIARHQEGLSESQQRFARVCRVVELSRR